MHLLENDKLKLQTRKKESFNFDLLLLSLVATKTKLTLLFRPAKIDCSDAMILIFSPIFNFVCFSNSAVVQSWVLATSKRTHSNIVRCAWLLTLITLALHDLIKTLRYFMQWSLPEKRMCPRILCTGVVLHRGISFWTVFTLPVFKFHQILLCSESTKLIQFQLIQIKHILKFKHLQYWLSRQVWTRQVCCFVWTFSRILFSSNSQQTRQVALASNRAFVQLEWTAANRLSPPLSDCPRSGSAECAVLSLEWCFV